MKHISSLLFDLFFLFTITNLLPAQWIQTNGIQGEYITSNLVVSSPNLVAGAIGGLFVTVDSGATWSRVNIVGNDSSVTAIAVGSNGVGGTNLFASSFGPRVFLSTDNGITWSVSGILSSSQPHSLVVSSHSLFAGTYAGIYRSTNNGATWTPANNGLPYTFSLPLIWTLAASGTNLFAGTIGNGLFLSTDDGMKWTQVTNGLRTSDNVTKVFVSGTTILAGVLNNGVFRSTDNGTSWSKSKTSLADTVLNNVNDFTAYGTMMFASEYSSGVWISKDAGENWAPINTGLPNVSVMALAVYGTNLYAAAGFTICRRSLSELLTSVSISKGIIPICPILEQNYPNPFNPSTTISFSLPSRSLVSLKVFDDLGREMSSLFSEVLPAGTYSRKWNATGFPSGIYFYRLQTASFTETKKLLLLR
jgi:photosystem II stability/assembly factor-like uncharacterized protein